MIEEEYEKRKALEEEFAIKIQDACRTILKEDTFCRGRLYERALTICDLLFVTTDAKNKAVDCIKEHFDILVKIARAKKIAIFEELGLEYSDDPSDPPKPKKVTITHDNKFS